MLSAGALGGLGVRGRQLLPGLIASVVIAAAANFLSDHYGAPVMLFALLLGMAMNFLSTHDQARPGIEFAAREVLRVGVALLGLRITLGQIAALGWHPVALIGISVVVTILMSMLAARALGFNVLFGLLSGGATAICGASAALALAAALPAHPGKERATLFTVIGVSALSTFAMIGYPLIAQALGFSSQTSGIFLGATIHDVAQVVGAGYGMSPRGWRHGNSRETDAGGDAGAGDRLRCHHLAVPRRREWTPASLAAVVRRGIHHPRRAEQRGLGGRTRAAARQRAVALVPDHRYRCHRDEDRTEAARCRRPPPRSFDGRRNGLSAAAGTVAAALGRVMPKHTVH